MKLYVTIREVHEDLSTSEPLCVIELPMCTASSVLSFYERVKKYVETFISTRCFVFLESSRPVDKYPSKLLGSLVVHSFDTWSKIVFKDNAYMAFVRTLTSFKFK